MNIFNEIPSINTSSIISKELTIEHVHFISDYSQFPAPSNGIIKLSQDSVWVLCDHIDLQGNRIVCDGDVSISGFSSETCSLYSTLGNGVALLTSNYTLPLYRLTLGCSTNARIFNLVGDGTNGIDITSVNFGSNSLSCGSLGTISNFSNIIFTNCAFFSHTDGITFDGSVGTIGIQDSIFTGSATSHIYLPNTLTVSRRFRIIYSSLVVAAGKTGITYTNANIPNDGLILDTINFSGLGTYVSGITFQSNITAWSNCVGITNSFAGGSVFIRDNVVATTFTSSGVFKIFAGTTTTDNSTLSKFTHSNYTLTYTGSRNITVLVAVNSTLEGNNAVNCHIAIAKDGVTIDTSEMAAKLQGAGNRVPCSTNQIINISTGSAISCYIRNDTNTSNITCHDIVMTITRINS